MPYFEQYAQRFTDLPLLVTLRERGDGYVADRLLRASDLGSDEEHAEWMTVVLDRLTGEPSVPRGSVGHRYGSEPGRWNLRLDGIAPALTLLDRAHERVPLDVPRFDLGESEGGTSVRRGVPAMRVGGRLVTTVLDLVLAQYGVAREGCPVIGRRATTTSASRVGPRGRRGSPRSTVAWWRRSRGSSLATRS